MNYSDTLMLLESVLLLVQFANFELVIYHVTLRLFRNCSVSHVPVSRISCNTSTACHTSTNRV